MTRKIFPLANSDFIAKDLFIAGSNFSAGDVRVENVGLVRHWFNCHSTESIEYLGVRAVEHEVSEVVQALY